VYSQLESLADRLLNLVVPRKTALAACNPRTYYVCSSTYDPNCNMGLGGYYLYKCQLTAGCDERCSFNGCCFG
jgi:hypothetical protein